MSDTNEHHLEDTTTDPRDEFTMRGDPYDLTRECPACGYSQSNQEPALATCLHPDPTANPNDRPVDAAVLATIVRQYAHKPALVVSILKALRWDVLNGCWCYGYAGMYVGVETDGYSHT